MTVKKVALISAEGMEFVVDRSTAMASSSLRELIRHCDEEATEDAEKVRFTLDVSSPTLERLCRRLCHHYLDSLGQGSRR